MGAKNKNEEFIKAITTSDFAGGGTLKPEQQKQFIWMVKDQSHLLKYVRFETMKQKTKDIDKLWIGEPITEGAGENTEAGYDNSKVETQSVNLSTTKVRSSIAVTHDSLVDNIEQEDFEDNLMKNATTRVSTDMEMLAIQGDETKYSAGTTKVAKLLKVKNGWDILTNSAHILDVAGGNISKKLFARMFRQLPIAYRGDPGLRWVISSTTLVDWQDLISDRATTLGDDALKGMKIAPHGIPFLPVPLIPDNQDVSTTAVTAGYQLATNFGPYRIGSSNNKLKIDVDNAGTGTGVEVTIASGTYTASELAAKINAADASFAGIASDSGDGRLLIQSTTTGATSEIDIQAPSADSAYAEIGLTVAVDTGSDAGTADTMPEGSFMLLCNPKNLIFGMTGATRTLSEFNKDKDRAEIVIYNYVDMKIENTDAIVKAKNIRMRDLA